MRRGRSQIAEPPAGGSSVDVVVAALEEEPAPSSGHAEGPQIAVGFATEVLVGRVVKWISFCFEGYAPHAAQRRE
jgi:hypothetical protein